MVQRPNGLRIYLYDQQRGKPRRPSAGCFRPPSKQTSTTHGCICVFFSLKNKNKKITTLCHSGVLKRKDFFFFCRYGEKGGRVGFDGGGRGGGKKKTHTPNFLFLWVTCVQFPLPRHPTTASSPLLRTEKRGTTCRVAVTRLVSHFGPPMDESRSPQHVGSGGGVSSSGCCQCPPPPSCFVLCALCVCVCVPSKTTSKHTLLLLLLQVVKASFESICGSGPVYFLLL